MLYFLKTQNGREIVSRCILDVALQRADANPYIRGSHTNGIRDRLESFMKHVLSSQFDSLETSREKTIVYADFRKSFFDELSTIFKANYYTATNNLLFDPTTLRITALIDYDFACIMHPSYEFLRSFDGAGGQFRRWSGDEPSEQAALRNAKLHRFPSPLPPSTKGGIDREVAKAWEEALERLNVKRPKTMK